MSQGLTLPNGTAHLAALTAAEERVKLDSASHLPEYRDATEIIGTSLNALYQAATCNRTCHGGEHILEGLCGRAYNLGWAAYSLSMSGLYDEALNLVRGLGELANLIGLSVADPPSIQDWINSDRKTRLSRFSPAKIRAILERKRPELIFADRAWYGELSEDYTHVTPQTKPNFHDGRRFVGGTYQSKGMAKALEELAFVLCHLAMLICGFFKFPDLLDLLAEHLKGALANGTSTSTT